MKITFIRPNMFAGRAADAMQPLSFAILKSLTPRAIETAFYDERLEPIPVDEPTDLVAMTVETYTARRSYQLVGEFRQRGVPVVMGGYHPTFLPDEALQYCDAVVIGDAEGIWHQVIQDTQDGCLQSVYQQDEFPDLAGSNPDRSIFQGKRYAPADLVQYGRGCKYRCDFCSIRAFYGSFLRQRPVGEVVDEIRSLKRKHIFLVDDNIFVDLEKARELFEALIPLNIRWSCQVSIDVVQDHDLVDLMRRSGCLTALVGFESLDPDNLKQMKKGWNLRYGSYDDAVGVLQQSGIMIYGTFVFGYDQDTVESFDASVDFAIRHKFYLANFNPLTPTPGADLYDRLESEGRLIFDRWWLDPDFRYGHATFHPSRMTADELTEGCYRSRMKFNTLGSMLSRGCALKTNLRSPYRSAIYLISNLISRREILSKQDRQLGEPGDLPAPGDPGRVIPLAMPGGVS